MKTTSYSTPRSRRSNTTAVESLPPLNATTCRTQYPAPRGIGGFFGPACRPSAGFFGSFTIPFAYSSSCASLIPVCVCFPARFLASSAPINRRCFSLVAGMVHLLRHPPHDLFRRRAVDLDGGRVIPIRRQPLPDLALHPLRGLAPSLLEVAWLPHPHDEPIRAFDLQIDHDPVAIRPVVVRPESHPPEAVKGATLRRPLRVDPAPNSRRTVPTPRILRTRRRRHPEDETARRAGAARPPVLPNREPRLERRHSPSFG